MKKQSEKLKEKFRAMSKDLVIRVQKPLYFVMIIPVINELSRTILQALHKQELDFQFFKKNKSENLQKIQEEAAMYADLIRKGNLRAIFLHLNEQLTKMLLLLSGKLGTRHRLKDPSIHIDLVMKSPYFILPSNSFKSSHYI